MNDPCEYLSWKGQLRDVSSGVLRAQMASDTYSQSKAVSFQLTVIPVHVCWFHGIPTLFNTLKSQDALRKLKSLKILENVQIQDGRYATH